MLRDYQQEMFDKIRHELCTHQGVCGVLPCRSGKSYIMKEIVEHACLKGNKVLILAHRHLLINQHKELIKNCRIASVFTEVNHLGQNGNVDLILIDEAHLSEANSYKKVCEFYNCKRILFTATACRLDGQPLSLADVIVNGISGDDLIKRGAVSSYDLYAPKVNIDLSNVEMSGSDFNQEQLAEVMLDKKIYGDIIKNYLKFAKGKQALAYCVNIKHSKAVCDLFNSNGIPAIHIDASTPEKDRTKILCDYKNGKYKILCNCNLISEGITLPECDCCLLLRPTQSEALYIQQSCRCLTPKLNKRAVIIDFVGNCFAHGTPTEARVYSLEKNVKVKNPSREPEVLIRICKNCYQAYPSSIGSICPFCNFENGKTKLQIKQDQEAELQKITEINRKNKRKEVGMCKTVKELIDIATERKYNRGWVVKMAKVKHINISKDDWKLIYDKRNNFKK